MNQPVRYRVLNPATGEVEREYPTATDEQIQDLLVRANAAYSSWRRTPVAERSAVLSRVADLYEERKDELAALITREMGKTTPAARAEAAYAGRIYRYYAESGPAMLADTPVDSRTPGSATVRKNPTGAILGIMPWNFPYYQVARFAGPNLMAGNTIVLKHAPQCPESALAMEKIFHEAGLPADAYLNVFASNEQAATMIADPRITGVSVTGSERAGTAVAAVAGQHLKKVVLELGGSDPFIVLSAADLDTVVQDAVTARMANSGQACTAAKRMIVAEPLFEDFLASFTKAMAGQRTGDPTDPQTDFGPLSSEQAAETLLGQIEDAVGKGATVLTGGHRVDRPGSFVEATVLTGVTPDMRAYHEELFGPVAVVYRVAGADEAVELANSSVFGLGAAVYSSDEATALDVADRLEVGMVWINQREGGGADLPFGGTKRSGIGRELGTAGIDEFVNKKLIHTP